MREYDEKENYWNLQKYSARIHFIRFDPGDEYTDYYTSEIHPLLVDWFTDTCAMMNREPDDMLSELLADFIKEHKKETEEHEQEVREIIKQVLAKYKKKKRSV